jgi:copper(I)-binding protein
MKQIHHFFLAALFALATHLPTTAFAQDAAAPVTAGPIEISGAWTRAMLAGQKVAGGFVTITNTGDVDDRLIAAASSASPDVQIHEMAIVNDVMEMRQLKDGISIPAGQTVELKPGGLHLMFMNVAEPFKDGATVPVTLTFEKAGTVELTLPVAPPGAKAMPQGHGHMKHGG